MHRFRVWGPRAKRVSVVVDGERYAMEREPRGWWAATVEGAHAGSRYGFLLDDDETPVPDPRSARQPEGVHGLSELVDHTAFAWSDAGWRPPTLASSVIYELHPGTFTHGGNAGRRDRAAGVPARAGHYACRADAAGCGRGRARMGLRRRGALRSAGGIWRPGCGQALRGCGARTRARGADRRGLQPLRAQRQLHRQVRRLPHGSSHDAVGRCGEF